MYYAGLDVGGTNVRLALINEENEIIEEIETTTLADQVPDLTLAAFITKLNEWETKYELNNLGIGSPGPLDYATNQIVGAENLPGWKHFEIVKYFQDRTNIETITLENDANVNALGQAVAGPGHGAENLIYVTISTGVGVGAVINNKIYRGSHGLAAEVDRFLVDFNQNKDFNVNFGIEGTMSGTGICATAVKNGLDCANAKEVFDLYGKNEIATKVIDYAIECGGLFILNLMAAYDPEMIVLGGSVITKNPWMLEKMLEVTNEYARSEFTDQIKVVITDLDKGGVIGAALNAK